MEGFITPPPKVELSPDKTLSFIKPLYGTPESGLYCGLSYLKHVEDNLDVMRCQVDPSIFYEQDKGWLVPTVNYQVDDSIVPGSSKEK